MNSKIRNSIYNNVSVVTLLRCLLSKKGAAANETINICIDRRETNAYVAKHFNEYLWDSLQKKTQDNIDIIVRESYQEKALQAVDFISWALFRKYERGDESYYTLIKDKIVVERKLFL